MLQPFSFVIFMFPSIYQFLSATHTLSWGTNLHFQTFIKCTRFNYSMSDQTTWLTQMAQKILIYYFKKIFCFCFQDILTFLLFLAIVWPRMNFYFWWICPGVVAQRKRKRDKNGIKNERRKRFYCTNFLRFLFNIPNTFSPQDLKQRKRILSSN